MGCLSMKNGQLCNGMWPAMARLLAIGGMWASSGDIRLVGMRLLEE